MRNEFSNALSALLTWSRLLSAVLCFPIWLISHYNMRVLLSLSESTPCSHCHISNLCDFHISIALLIGARSHISHPYTEHAQFLAIFRELLNTSHFWKRRMLSAHRWFHLRVEQRQNHSRLPSSRLTMQIMFRLVFSVIRLQVPFDNPKHLSIHGARLTHHMTETLLPTSCSSACCFVKAPLSPQ